MLTAGKKAILNEAAGIGTFLLKRFHARASCPPTGPTGSSSGPSWAPFRSAAGNAWPNGFGRKIRLPRRFPRAGGWFHATFVRPAPDGGSIGSCEAAFPLFGGKRGRNDAW